MKIRRLVDAVLWTLVIVFCLGITAASIVPRVMGLDSSTVLTPSMKPGISPGDQVIVKPVSSNELKIGDVVMYRKSTTDKTDTGGAVTITHRLVGKSFDLKGRETLILKGDNNGVPDKPVVGEQVVGKVVVRIPMIGYVLGNPTLKLALFAALIISVLYLVLAPSPAPKQEETTWEPEKARV